jgi:hypothetical protein
MYAYQCGQYEQCLQMSQQNVSSLWHQTTLVYRIPIFGFMTQLMNDDVASLNAINVLNKAKFDVTLYQLTISLCLIIETKLKLKYSLKSKVDELRRVVLLFNRLPITHVGDRLLLSLIYRKAIIKSIRERSRRINTSSR